MFSIRVTHSGQHQDRLVWFAHNEITVGRTARNDLRLDEPVVSKRHMRIVLKDGKYIVVDLKSTNGTYVNKRRLRSPRVIHPERDVIAIGNFTLTLSETTNPGIEPARPVQRTQYASDGDDEITEVLAVPFPSMPGPAVTDEERALLQCIHDAFEQDGPRLVYADWLIENGDPRGELIALQCLDHATREAVRVAPDAGNALSGDNSGEQSKRSEQIQRLLRKHGCDWLAPFVLTRPVQCLVLDGTAAIGLEFNDDDNGALRAQLCRGFLAYPLCATRTQVAAVTPAVFRLSPTLYQIEGRISPDYSTWRFHLYRGQVLGPMGTGAQVAIRCAPGAAGLEDPRDQGLPRQRQQDTDHLLQRWRLCARFDHPNIVRTHGLGSWSRAGDLALATDWVDGISLDTLVEESDQGTRLLPEYALAAIGYQCLLAIEYMRAARPIDLSDALATATLTLTPDDVMVARDGAVKLVEPPWLELEYRMQNLRNEQWYPGQHRHEQYVAPRLRGAGQYSSTRDGYHIASLLYQLSGGTLPGYQPNVAAPGLDPILRRAMAANPKERYSTTSELRAALAGAFGKHWQQRARSDSGVVGGRDALAGALFANDST